MLSSSPSLCVDPQQVSSYLNGLGVSSPQDMKYFSADQIQIIVQYYKPIPQRRLGDLFSQLNNK
jgi:hypothetical protein